MVGIEALQGYLLEEVLARLLFENGYRLLVSAQQDPDALAEGNHGLLVRGRGSDHQADVLGELTLPTPFSLPLRIFVEAKYRRATTGLAAVRNAHGVVHDVNEYYSTAHHGRLRLPVQRHLYRYALFSTSGFTRPAQQYALAQQVFLVDLSGQAFKGLRGGVEEAARQLHELAAATGGPFPRGQVRTALRLSLDTWTAERIPPEDTTIDVLGRESSARNPARAEDRELPPRRLAGIADSLASRVGDSLLLGFPSAPFVLVFRPDDLADFGAYIAEHGTDIDVRITRRDVSSDWVVVPADGTRAFRLPFSLPALLADWLLGGDPATVAVRAKNVKAELLSFISVFHAGRLVRLVFRPRTQRS